MAGICTETYPVRKDVDLNQHQVGEVVVFELTKMVAISIEKLNDTGEKLDLIWQ